MNTTTDIVERLRDDDEMLRDGHQKTLQRFGIQMW